MGISAGQRDALRSAIAENRLRALNAIGGEIGKHHLDPEVEERHRLRMRDRMRSTSGWRQRWNLLMQGSRAAKIVSQLGDAIFDRKYDADAIIDRVNELVSLDCLDSDAVDRICERVLS